LRVESRKRKAENRAANVGALPFFDFWREVGSRLPQVVGWYLFVDLGSGVKREAPKWREVDEHCYGNDQ
jgi:hypothetical protein